MGSIRVSRIDRYHQSVIRQSHNLRIVSVSVEFNLENFLFEQFTYKYFTKEFGAI